MLMQSVAFILVGLSVSSVYAAGQIPENAELDKNALQGWSCKSGFVQSDNTCVSQAALPSSTANDRRNAEETTRNNISDKPIEIRLGEVALRMAPTEETQLSAVAVFSPTGQSDRSESNGLSVSRVESPTLHQDLVDLQDLLKAGANPAKVRINGFRRAGCSNSGGMMFCSGGAKGSAVQTSEGGITLREFFETYKLSDALAILNKYEHQKGVKKHKKNK